MTETGWPLIPREVLPAPVPAARRRLPRRPPQPADPSRQLPFFGAETTEPQPADLAGLLAGPGRLGRMGGTARVSVEVDAAWRVHVLVAELVIRGLVASWRPLQSQRDDALPGPAGVLPPDDIPPTEDDDDVFFDDLGPEAMAEVRRRRARERARRSSAADEPRSADLVNDGRDHTRRGANRPIPVQGDLSPPDQRPTDTGKANATRSARPGRETPPEPNPDGVANKGTDHNETDDTGADRPDAAPKPRFEVLTAYSRRLNGLARAWPDAAAQLFLSGPRLRLWVAAAGEPAHDGYALGLDPAKDPMVIDAALVRAGLAGRSSDDGRHYLIMGRRRLRRLAELVGERPEAVPAELWPGGAGA